MTERERAELLALLAARFETHPQRHPDLAWATVSTRLDARPAALLSLWKMEASGGALFCDRRYGRVFVYHNGAQSYYAARGFRGVLAV